jgi:hypothetical protein
LYLLGQYQGRADESNYFGVRLAKAFNLSLEDTYRNAHGLYDGDPETSFNTKYGYQNYTSDNAYSGNFLYATEMDKEILPSIDTAIISTGEMDLHWALSKALQGIADLGTEDTPENEIQEILKTECAEKVLQNCVTNFKESFNSIISTMKTENPNIHIYVSTIYHDSEPYSSLMDPLQDEMNSFIIDGASSGNYTVVDTASALKDYSAKNSVAYEDIPDNVVNDTLFKLYYKAITGNDYTGDISIGDSNITVGDSNEIVPTVNESPKTGDHGIGKIAFAGGAAVIVMAVALKARKKSDKE